MQRRKTSSLSTSILDPSMRAGLRCHFNEADLIAHQAARVALFGVATS
jgi:hypothetical protein